ncbi:MAG: isochorismatase family cysteine hydrolase [Telluria sp.]|nr:isochorismatase family cysteine hydrolase [Telluria sp.]
MSAAVPPNSLRPARLPRSRRVLLLIDFINPLDFPGAEKLAGPAVAAARAAAGLKQQLAAEGVATIYANDNYGVWQSDFHSLVSACLGMEGPPGEIARLVYPQAGDLTILKPRHSAFFASPLELLLAEMQARELVICGLATDMCVQLTAGDAFLRQFATWVPADCTAAESSAAKAASLDYMATVLKCDTRPWAKPAARRASRKAAHA